MNTVKALEILSGNKLYQQRARLALPLLVRQAHAISRIFYSNLAAELGMPNPRNLNYVLGCVGNVMKTLSKEWGSDIPPIQCIVVNKQTGLPGEGIGWFITNKNEFRKLPLKQQRLLVEAKLQEIFSYPKWPLVLQELGLKLAPPISPAMIKKASAHKATGESPEHKKLKIFVAEHPTVVYLPPATPNGSTEYDLPSGDRIDILFVYNNEWVGVEVKSKFSPEADIARGIFQCVKYQAILEAYQASQGMPPRTRTILVLGGRLPPQLVALKNILGVEVLEEIRSK
jgi:hypothetical protein